MSTDAIAKDDLEELRLPALRDRFLAVVGEPTRCPNRTYLIRRIREAQAQRAIVAPASPKRTPAPRKRDTAPAPPPEPKPDAREPRGRFASMTIEELQQKYREVVGRTTSSEHRGYLKWKIREAERGRVPTGPRAPRTPGAARPMRVLPLRIEVSAIEQMDAAWRAHGIRSRTAFLRKALGSYLTGLGAHEAAALLSEG
jgi:hypothetical protein